MLFISDLEPVAEDIVIRLEDVLEYVGDSVRPIREGLAVLSANHIVCIGYTSRSGMYIHAKGYVLQSSHPGGIPHEVSLKICQNHQFWDLNCSCKAGTRRCKHIVACLLRINQCNRLEKISCTDSAQAWGYSKIEKTSLWGAKLIQDLCCVRQRKPNICVDVGTKEQLLSESFRKIIAVSSQSAIAKHMVGRHENIIQFRTGISSIAHVHTDIYCTEQELQSVLFSGNDVTELAKTHFIDHSHQVFYEKFVCVTQQQRSRRITASSCYGLFTYSKNPKPNWEKKIYQYLKPSNFQTKSTRYGKQTEETAFLCYAQKRNPAIKKTGFVIKYEDPWIGGSPDGLDTMARIVLEIKCPAAGEEHDLHWIMANCSSTQRYVKIDGDAKYYLNKKHSYYAQCQVNMHILNCETTDFIVYSKQENDFIVIEVGYDKTFAEELLHVLKKKLFFRNFAKTV
ncbi:uncharacterized protein LOC131688009 [Topomyia yanbarensis]|uniref:uncharacterized protein LOC131688009 n=1 Tax=Topomyia yanbarensis TaxID=2498891 RepID=UPI00273BAAF0|nr:uncharacterized protein LOC131688009 [Topomyia yanbarensis]